jgi:mannose-6-phosphate isomerase
VTLKLLSNQPRDYAWGSTTLLAELRGEPEASGPEAELWFGTHPMSPALTLPELEPLAELTDGPLGFLVKLLAAEQPLSIQAHPSRERAAAQFALENQRGLALDDPSRNYRDDNHKPELLVAITDFSALCGFRPLTETMAEVESQAANNSEFDAWLRELEAGGYQAAVSWAFANPQLADALSPGNCLTRKRARLVADLQSLYQSDAGVLVSLMLNLVQLAPGEAIYLPAGNLHSYLGGLGVEVMAASDNVLRGGLTKKRVDVAELTAVLDYRELPDPKLSFTSVATGVTRLIGTDDFEVYRLEPSASTVIADLELKRPTIAVCTAGSVMLSTSLDVQLELKPGQAAYLGPEARLFSVAGSGTLYCAMG